MNIWQILEKAVSQYADDIAVIDGDRRFTYSQLSKRVLDLATFFNSRGIGLKDRIAVLEVNSLEFMEAYYAAAALGAILTPVNHRLAANDLSYILKDSGARWVISSAQFGNKLTEAFKGGEHFVEGVVWIGERDTSASSGIEQVDYEKATLENPIPFTPNSIASDEVAHLYYTSGTTGEPKGVPLTHRNVIAHAECAVREIGLDRSDIWGHIAPMFHLADAWATFAITMVGGKHVMLDRFEAAATMKLIESEGITISNLIPTMLNLMTGHPDVRNFNFESLRVVLSGGAPIAKEVVRRIMDLFDCDYIQTYGMTETSPYLLVGILPDHLKSLPPEERLSFKAKTGRRFSAVELKVVNDNGIPVVKDGREVGEIWVRGETVTRGYWNRPKATAESFYKGWLKTGDLAVVDHEEFVNIVDRKKDMILTGGENVYSTEVENTLYENNDILEAAVFGLPDETWGEAVTAAVVIKKDRHVDEETLVGFCRQRLAGYKTPKRVFFVDELPKTGSGKISKKKLREKIHDQN